MSSDKKQTILVTGGLGYIGSHTVVELIHNGYDVVIIDNLSNSQIKMLDAIQQITKRKPEFKKIDLLDYDSLLDAFNSYDIDAVIHFASLKSVPESITDPIKYYDNNVTGTINLIKAMKKQDIKRIVFSSSAAVYGDRPNLPVTEETQSGVGISNPYGETKHVIENILAACVNADSEFEVSILRYFNVAGAHSSGLIGDNPAHVPDNLMPYVAKVAVGELESLPIFGDDYQTPDGTAVRDYIHVVDLAQGHISALKHLRKGFAVYNLGTGHGTSVMEIRNAFVSVNNIDVPYIITSRRAGDIEASFADATKAEREIKWKAVKTIDDIVRDTWNYFTTKQTK